MDEETENTVDNGPAEPEESGTAVKDELIAVFKNTLDISQDLESPESASSEKTQSWEKLEQRDGEGDGQQDGQKDGQQDEQKDGQQDGQKDGQQDGQKDGQQDGQQDGQKDGQQDEQKDGQQDGQTVPPPAAEPGTESKWAVGAQCLAVWSEDGRLYPATVLCLDGERCRVRFNGYGNQQDVDLSTLKSPDAAPQTQRQNSQDWKPGARCRAVYAEDGLVYPAVVLWVKGQRCGVRFDDYNNEEEVDAGNLMNPDELHGPSRVTAAKVKEKPSNRRKVEKEEKKRGNQQTDEAEKPTNHSLSFFPPFPPPPSPRSASGDAVSFIPPPPPPPPLWAFGGKGSSSAAVDASSSMLMLWYMCGFHTGSYMAQQEFQSSSKD